MFDADDEQLKLRTMNCGNIYLFGFVLHVLCVIKYMIFLINMPF